MVKYPRRWQFGLRTIFFAMLSIGVALTVTRIMSSWIDGLFSVVALAAVIGLAHQIVDLLRYSAAQRANTGGNRGAVGLAIAWRAFLVVFIELTFFGSHIREFTKETTLRNGGFGTSFPEFAYYLFIVIALQTKPVQPPKPSLWKRGLIGVLGFVACAIWLFFVWMDLGTLTYLVHAAISGIFLSQRLSVMDQPFLGAHTRGEADHHLQTFLVVTTTGVVFLLLALLLLFIVARRAAGRRSWTSRVLVASSLMALLAAVAAVFWIEVYGIQGVSPFIAQNRHEMQSMPTYCFFAMIVLTAVTAMTYEFIGRGGEERPVWASRATYMHEHWIIALLAMLSISEPILDVLRVIDAGAFWLTLTLHSILTYPPYVILFAIFVTAVRNVYRAFAYRRAPPVERRLLRSSRMFMFLWVCLLVWVLAAGPLLLWSSFAAWADERLPPEFLMPNEE